jgi:hypothetical protein
LIEEVVSLVLGVLLAASALMIVAFVVSLLMLRRRHPDAKATRS